MNILITRFPYESQLSGEEWHTLTLAEKFRERGHTIFLASSCIHLLREFAIRNFATKKVSAGKPPVTKSWLIVFTILSPCIFIRLATLLIVQKITRRINTMYCLSLTEKLLLTPVARLLGINVIWLEHARIDHWLTRNPWAIVYLLWDRLCAPRIIFVSHQSKRRLVIAGKFTPKKTHMYVIPNGINLKLFNPCIAYLDVAKQLPQKPKDQFWIGTITRLSKDKGIPHLVQAVHIILEKLPQLHCYIIGEGTEEKAYRQKFANDHIHFFGTIEHDLIPVFLKQLDIFILASNLHDPFGLAAAEAMAVGIPVIATDMCGITDFLEKDVHAAIVPANKPNALARAIEKIATEKAFREKLSKNGLELARKKFDLTEMIKEYEKLIVEGLG